MDWRPQPGAADLALGTRRARAAVLLSLALPGSSYLYQGEELGLWEVEDIPDELIADPIFLRSEHRIPRPRWLPGAAAVASGRAWLRFRSSQGRRALAPQPTAWRQLAAAAQAEDPGSMLALYRAALRVRAARDCLDDDSLTWLTAPDNVLAFSRPGRFACMVNISGAPVPLPPDARVLLASEELDDGKLPPDSAAWLRTGTASSADR